MFELKEIDNTNKQSLYSELAEQARSLVHDEKDLIANTANLSALLFYALPDVNWVGFYLLKDGELVVGPFQGKPACIRIPMGKGVCGTAAAERKSLVVEDVNAFAGHIFCDSASRSEVVVPLVADEKLLGVLDIDSPNLRRFDEDDRAGLETIAAVLLETISRNRAG
ncbi:MAG TPA: GAF domain-containing protein [Gammaproteobacteria bacterium]|jgi:GAF domain-containing protein|nr:GAF domain-containing protein [Gammaproteobacteria bacterium]